MAKATEQDLKNAKAQVDKVQAEIAEKSLLGRTKRRLKRLFSSEEKPAVKKEMSKTNRTKQIEAGLKQAGLKDAEIAKFQPKGKK